MPGRLVRHDARHALHCHLLHQPGRRSVQGCGRTFDEVQHWPAVHASARCGGASRWSTRPWRFTRYAERAAEAASIPPAV